MDKSKGSWAVALVTNRQEVDDGRMKDSYKLAVSEHHDCTQAEAIGEATVKALSGPQGFMVALLQTASLHMPQPEVVDLSATIDLNKVVVDKEALTSVLKFGMVALPYMKRGGPANDVDVVTFEGAIAKLRAALEGKG